MAQEQTALVGEPIEVLVNVIGSAGTHEAATINTTTTRIDGFPATAPTVTTVATGIYKISFSGVTPAPAEGDRLTVKVNGTVTSTSTAWSEYGIPVKILAEERGTDNASTFDASTDTVTTDSASRTASQADVSALATSASIAALNDIAATDIVSGGAITTSGGAVSNVTTVATTTTNSDMRGTDGANTVAPDNASIAAILVDTGTDIPASIAALNDFDPASDTVANVSAVGSVTNPVTTDAASRTASQADVSSLATAASISALNDFDPASDTVANVTTTANVTNAVTTDTASRDASKADVSGLSTFDASTDQVVASNMRGTDNALLASSAPSNFGSLGINSSGHILRTVLNDTTTTNSDMVSVAGLAQSSEIAALNDISAADVWTYSTRTITSGGITAGEVSDAVWDVALSGYNSAGTTGKAIRQIKEGVISQDGQVNDPSATATTFISNLSSAVDGYYHDKVIVFVSGSLSGQARHIETYTGSTKSITVSEAFTSAPTNGSEFLILATHEHSLNEIADATWDEQRSGHTDAGSFGFYLDARVSQSGGGASAGEIWNALLQDYTVAGSFGARFQEADRYTNTTAQIKYVNQGDAYDTVANPALEWAVTKDFAGATSITLYVEHRVTGVNLLTHAVTYTDATTLNAYLSSSDTAFSALTTDADFGVHPYWIVADYSGELQTVVKGAMSIQKSN